MQDDVDMDREAALQNKPYVIRLMSDTGFEYIVMVERNLLFDEFRNIRDAYVMLFASYFTFNIQYPPLLSCALLFIQHYIYSLPVGTKKLPISITRVYSACAKM